MSNEREKSIREDAEFKGMVLATLKAMQKENVEFNQNLKNHLLEEMIELKEFNMRLLRIENWKIKVVTLSGFTGAVFSLIVSFLFSKL